MEFLRPIFRWALGSCSYLDIKIRDMKYLHLFVLYKKTNHFMCLVSPCECSKPFSDEAEVVEDEIVLGLV
jgi:hypothetical protein